MVDVSDCVSSPLGVSLAHEIKMRRNKELQQTAAFAGAMIVLDIGLCDLTHAVRLH